MAKFWTVRTRRVAWWTIVLGFVLSFIIGVAVTVARPSPHINFVVSSQTSISSLNYVKENSGTAVYGALVEGLLAPSPVGVESDRSDSLSTIIDTPKFSARASFYETSRTGQTLNTFDRFEPVPSSAYQYADNEFLTYGAADRVTFSSDRDEPERQGRTWKFHIRENAMWANGDRVSAEDFVQTIRYAIDLRNGSTLIRDFRDAIPLKGANALIAEQEAYFKANGQYRSSIDDYAAASRLFSINGGVWTLNNPYEASSSFTPYPGAKTLANAYLYYQLEDGLYNQTFFYLLGKSLFLPTNARFIASIGGIDQFGISQATILASGPFVLESFDPDYAAVLVRNEGYWDKGRTISSRWMYRIVPYFTTSVHMFLEGKLSEVSVSSTYLRVFQESSRLKRLLKQGGSGASTTFLKWNLANDPTTGAGAVNKTIVNNVHLRRAVSLAINRKRLLDVNGIGANTQSGDTFSPALSFFADDNNNTLEDYLWRTSYALNGKDLGPMTQYDPKEATAFANAEYIAGIKVDRYQDVALAKAEFAEFLRTTPSAAGGPVVINLIYGYSSQLLVLMLQQELQAVFGDQLVINARVLPEVVVSTSTRENKGYDLAIQQITPDTQTDAWTALRLLAAPAPVGSTATTSINVTGGWTFAEGLTWVLANEPHRLKEIGIADMAAAGELLTLLTQISVSPRASLYGNVLTGEGYNNAAKMRLYTKLELLIRDQAPVIPLYHNSNGYFARRILGATNIAGWPAQYKYAYNGNDVPASPFSLPSLPS